MEAALKIVDETASGKVLRETTLHLASERISVLELIERRVRQEVEAFNAQKEATLFEGLVQPTGTEAELNGYRLRKPRRLDPDEQVAKALEAFGKNGFFLLVGDRQVESLEDEIAVGPEVVVGFVKLVPLVGG